MASDLFFQEKKGESSETGDTTESKSIDIEKECLVEKTSFDYGKDSALAVGDPNQTPTGSKIRTTKVLGKPLEKIDFSLNGDNNNVLLNTLLKLSPPVKNLVNVSIRKSFALDIGLDKIAGKLSQEKLAMVRKLFSKVNNFGGVFTPSKFAGIIKATFTSKLSMAQDSKKAEETKILVNTNLKKSSEHSNWTVVLKKIPIGTSMKAVCIALSEFRLIKSIKMQLNHKMCKMFTKLFYYIASVNGKSCVIDHYLVFYARTRCTTICFDSAESLDAVIKIMSVLKEANLHWSHFILAKYAECGKLGHTLLTCLIGEKKNVFSGALLRKILSNSDKNRLAVIYTKHLAPVASQIAGGSSFSPLLIWNILLKAGFFLELKPILLVSLELNDRFVTLKHSLASLTEHVDMLVKRLNTPGPTVSQLSPGHQPLVTPLSQNQGTDIVMSKSLVVVFNLIVISKIEKTLNNLLITVMSLLAKINNTSSDDIIYWHKKKDNLVSIFMESKLKRKICPWIVNKFDGVQMFTSGLEFDYLSVGVVVVINSSLVKHVCKISEVSGQLLSIKLLFKNKLSVSILGLYTAGNINSLIAKAVNKSFFVILGGNFNEDGSGKYASFKKCLAFGLVNALGGSSCIVKTIDYVLIFLNLVNVVVGRGMFSVEEYFDTDHQAVSVLVSLGSLLNKYNCKDVDNIKWTKFKDDTAANTAMFYDDFLMARIHSDLDAMWVALNKVLYLFAKAVFKRKWFKDYDHIFVKKLFKFHKLELLVLKLVKTFHLDSFGEFTSLLDKWESLDSVNASVVKFFFLSGSSFDTIWSVLSKIRKSYCFSKILKAKHIRESKIRSAIDKRMESFKLNKSHTIKSVLKCPFYKITLDHLVMDDELVLEPDLVRTKMDIIIEGWTRKHNVVSVVPGVWCCQYQPLEYVFNDVFFGVMCLIDFDEMSSVISNLPDEKIGFGYASGAFELLFGLQICSWALKEGLGWKSVLMNTCSIALIKTAHKIFFKIFLNRIFFACSKFNVFRRNNFSVLKGMSIQSPIFAIGSVIEDTLEKNHKLLVRIKMCDKFIQFFGGIYNGRVNRVHNGLDQEKMFFPFFWCIFYDPLLCEVKRQENVCEYRLDFHFMTRTGYSESQTGLTFFLTIGNSQVAMQHILNINNISINNDKMVAISINCRVFDLCLLISGLSISIAKKGESYQYLGIFLFIENLLKSSLARAHLDVQFFTNFMLRKTVSDKQFLYLMLAVFHLIIVYRIQFSFVFINVYMKWNTIIHKGLKSKSGLPLDFLNDAIHHLSLYASIVSFANSVGILGRLFVHRSHDLQVLSWHPRHSLFFPSYININSLDNFLAGIVWVFLGCNLFLGGLMTNVFHFQNGIPMSVILGEPTFYKCVSSLWHYGIVFVEQFHNHTGSKKLDPQGPVPHWFDISVHFLNNSGPSSVCNLLLPDVGLSNVLESHKFEVVCDHLLKIDSSYLSLFTDGSLSGLNTFGMKASTAVFFENIDLSLDVEAIALALECVLSSSLVTLFSDSQAVLDVCKLESMLTHPDFRNWCWIEHCHIANVIHRKNLNINWVKVRGYSGVLGNKYANTFTEAAAFSDMHLPHMIDEYFLRASDTGVSGSFKHFVGSGSRVLVDSLCADVDWSKSFLVWHLDSHLAAGFTSTQTVGFRMYFIKALHHHFLVAVHKHLYNRSYSSETCSSLFRSSLCVLQLLSTCISNVVVSAALCKGFNIVAFVHEFCPAFYNEVWLVHTKHQTVMEKDSMIPHDGSVPVSIFGFSSVLSADVVRLLGIADAFGISFGFCKSCLFFSGIGNMISVHISV
ncbi:hypothetical protein G9A89_015562 [Geosiphon pyriformis]|nr:hypothetical protein G9A89_015562 [Geosiphon pyriformis]